MLGSLRDSTFRKLFDLENGSVTARRIDSFITWLIIANLVALAMEHFPIYTGNEALFGTFDRISIYIFTLEYVLRLFAAGGRPGIPWQANPGFATGDDAFCADRPFGDRALLAASAWGHRP